MGLLSLSPLMGVDQTTALFNSMPTNSLEKHLAFYELYPEHPLGQKALERAAMMIKSHDLSILKQVASCFSRYAKGSLSSSQVNAIECLANHLPNRKLKGYSITSLEELHALPDKEVDLGKALIFSQHEGLGLDQVQFLAREYSAKLDLMALHVLALLEGKEGYMDKIIALNRFIFEVMHFRFPPQSMYAKDIDRYTFLPSVMDDHLGVCLGVTALYLAVAQRVDLPLEIITPPGHIFLRYNTGSEVINIETTARGVDVPTEHYLGVNTHTLPLRTVKEVVAMTHVNQASVFLQQRRFKEAICAYEKALPFCPDDLLTRELLGYALVLDGRVEEGKKYLEQVAYITPSYAVKRHALAEDYLKGKTDAEGIWVVFCEVNEERSSILKKIDKMQTILEKYPTFRDGLVQMAVAYLQLGRLKEALPYLERYHELDATDPTVEYYLAVLYGEYHDYNRSKACLESAEKLVAEKQFYPKALEDLRLAIRELVP